MHLLYYPSWRCTQQQHKTQVQKPTMQLQDHPHMQTAFRNFINTNIFVVVFTYTYVYMIFIQLYVLCAYYCCFVCIFTIHEVKHKSMQRCHIKLEHTSAHLTKQTAKYTRLHVYLCVLY